jgi:hypothetical protein
MLKRLPGSASRDPGEISIIPGKFSVGALVSEFIITTHTISRPQKLFAVNHYFVSQDFF